MMNSKTQSCMKIFVSLLATTSLCEAFSPIVSSTTTKARIPIHHGLQAHRNDDNNNNININSNIINTMDLKEAMKKSAASLSLASLIFMSSSTAHVPMAQAYNEFDSDTDTVEITVQALKDATGDTAASFKVFESINEIITEGKGVGGSLSAKGVNLERGFVADEDTTIYNPGLSLLTESEKNRILDAVIQNRKDNVAAKTWSSDNEYAYDFLKTKLDPLHMVELKGYLGVLPFYGAAVYLAALAVQQIARDIFPVAYIVSALAVFLPIFALILKGV